MRDLGSGRENCATAASPARRSRIRQTDGLELVGRLGVVHRRRFLKVPHSRHLESVAVRGMVRNAERTVRRDVALPGCRGGRRQYQARVRSPACASSKYSY